MLPQAIGPYRVHARLGEGGMGVVYDAIGPDGERVALKVLRAAVRSEALVRRFEREAAHHVEHPNVVRVVAAGTDDEGTPYIAFERLEGETLAERFARERPTHEEIVRFGVQACAGLAAAHARGIVHRDVKPSNLFVCTDGTLKVIDFGVALVDDARTRFTAPGAVAGTVGYLSPEQAEGRIGLDARSDVWSLGAVLYEGLTGVSPFRQDTPLATVVATLLGELVPIRVREESVPPALARAIERALARDPSERHASADAFRAALEESAVDEASPERARSAPSIRPGEQRVVALLFASGVRDVDVLEAAVATHGGSLLHLVGARALGLFGADRWEGDEVDRAARAALEARPFADRVAISSGWVTSAGRTIAGDALAAAERCAGAELAGVAVDPEAARALFERWSLARVAPDLYELEPHAGPRASDLVALVDRAAETAQLAAALRTVVVDRRALTALIVGPTGIGKSRLRAELTQLAQSEVPDVIVVSGSATPRSREADLALARDIARSVFSAIDVRTIHAALLEAMEPGPLARRHAEALSELLSSAPAGEADVARARDRFRAAFLDYFSALAAKRPVVLSLEDLHWADAPSVELLEDLMDAAADMPLLLAATARSELVECERHPFAGRDVVTVQPRALTKDDVALLARRVAGAPIAAELSAAIAERTLGNPFFVVQAVRALADEDRLDADPSALTLPATVEAAVQSRLDHLPEAERQLCRVASVWSRAFTKDELRALGIADPDPLLDALARRDLVTARRRAGAHQLKSALVGEVAYRSLGDDLRRELHARAADHLANAPGADPEERARHHARAGDDARAAEAYAIAAHAAARRGDAQSALRCADLALSLGASARFELHAVRVDALRFLGEKEAQGRALDDALSHAKDDAQRARALSERAVWSWRAGRSAEALRSAQEAALCAQRSGDRDARILARGRQFLVLSQAGRSSEAEEALAEAVALSVGAGPELRATALAWRAHHLATSGDLAARLDAFVELVELYEDLGDPRRAAGARTNLADAYNRLGAYAEAAEALETALADCRRVGNRTMEGYALLNLGYARIGLGAIEPALEALALAEEIAGATSEARLGVLVLAYRARAMLAGGRLEDAAREADRAASLAESMPALRVGALAIAALALTELGDVEGALERSERAVAGYEALGGVEEDEADVFLARSRALALAGHTHEAEAMRRRGHARIEAIAAAIGDSILRGRFLCDVPSHRALDVN